MASPPPRNEDVQRAVELYAQTRNSRIVAEEMGISPMTVLRYLDRAGVPREGQLPPRRVIHAPLPKPSLSPGPPSFARGGYQPPNPPPEPPPDPFAIEHAPPIGTSSGQIWEIQSLPDNTYRFGAFGDLHAASKYTRWDVREDLVRRAEAFGAQCILDTGNWIDGEKPFNRYDLECVGLDAQVKCLAANHPKTLIPIYAVTGADHEGWYVKSEGVDVGRYCESIMRDVGHQWTDLGYMQADIVLRNANNPDATSILRVMHPGGGTGYALSYRPQKIIESFEGGQKPAVLLLGHYHKIDFGLVRNVWYCQCGTQQDQTPFMAQRAIEAHIGGFLIEMEQDPETGAIIAFTPQARRYFDQAYYYRAGRANNRWNGSGPITRTPRVANVVR